MKTLTVGNVKSRFSQIIDDIEDGREIAVSYGKKKETIAVILPYKKYKKLHQKKIGLLENKVIVKLTSSFSITDDEFLKS